MRDRGDGSIHADIGSTKPWPLGRWSVNWTAVTTVPMRSNTGGCVALVANQSDVSQFALKGEPVQFVEWQVMENRYATVEHHEGIGERPFSRFHRAGY